MTRPLSSLRAPAEARSAAENPNSIHEISTEDVERFWTEGTDARSARDIREPLLAELIFAARDLAHRNIFEDSAFSWFCRECQKTQGLSELTHSATCRTGRVLRIVDALVATLDSKPAGLAAAPEGVVAPGDGASRCAANGEGGSEYGQPWRYRMQGGNAHLENSEGYWLGCVYGPAQEAVDHAERITASVNFCAGIPTEILLDEKPLASMTRSLNDVIAVRRILPRLAELRTSQGVAR